MKLENRFKQLRDFNVEYYTYPIQMGFQGPILCKFEDGELEYIENKRKEPFIHPVRGRDDGTYRVLVEIVGEEIASKAFKENDPCGWGVVPAEKHVIMDFNSKLQYEFYLPAREFLTNPDYTLPIY